MTKLNIAPAFTTQAEHDAALDATYHAGPTPGILVSDLLPPRPFEDDELLARFALAPVGEDGWAGIDTARVDGRAPSRTTDLSRSSAKYIAGLGAVFIRWNGVSGRGYRAELLRVVDTIDGRVEVAKHILVYSKSGQPVSFRDRDQAKRQLEPIIMASGRTATYWAWDPHIQIAGAVWTPIKTYFTKIEMQGRKGRWLIICAHVILACHKGKPVLDPTGCRIVFSSVEQAKAYCEREDGS